MNSGFKLQVPHLDLQVKLVIHCALFPLLSKVPRKDQIYPWFTRIPSRSPEDYLMSLECTRSVARCGFSTC